MANITLKRSYQNPEQRINWLLFGLILTMPLGANAVTNLFLLAILLHSLFTLKAADWKQGLTTPVYMVSGVFFLYYAFTILWADNYSEGITQLETKLSFLVSPFVIAANMKWLNRQHTRKLKWSLVYGSLLSMVLAYGYAIVRYFQTGMSGYVTENGGFVSYFTYTELSSPFMHVGYLSTFVGVAVITLFDEIVETHDRRVRNVIYSLLLLGYLFMLQGRMNVLALVIILGMAFLFYVIRYKRYKWLFLPVLPVAGGLALLPMLPESITSRYLQIPDFNYDITAEASEFNSATYRLAEWAGASRVIGEHALFGTGVGDNRESLIQAYADLGFQVGVDRRFNAHNQYLETWIASGLVGFILLMVMLIFWLNRLWHLQDHASALALLFFMLCMLTESMLERAWAVIFLAVYFPVLIFSAGRAEEVKKKL